MKQNIFNRFGLYTKHQVKDMLADTIPYEGRYHVRVTRADGTIEEKVLKNQVNYTAMNRLANRGVNVPTATTPFYVIGIGSATTVYSMNFVQSSLGEMTTRKVSNLSANAGAQSREYMFFTQTWAGFADSITGKQIDTAFVSDYPNSHASNGSYLNAVNGLGVTLQDSDFLALTVTVRVGSQNIGHTT